MIKDEPIITQYAMFSHPVIVESEITTNNRYAKRLITYQDIKNRTFATADILELELLFLPEQEILNNIELPVIWAKNKLIKAAIPNPNALLVGE